MQTKPVRVSGLNELAGNYDAVLCDVWGVLHNGVAAWPEAVAALAEFRLGGGTVIMITNAPRPRGPVMTQLESLGVPDGVFDDVVTSGDVTRVLIGEADRKVYHIGPERDLKLFDGLDIELVDRDEAETIVCTGLRDDRAETPEDYANELDELASRDLPFICANPDIVVEHGHTLIWCAGALARDYAKMGGETRIVGKPHRPIYEHAHARANDITGRELALDRILAIGDGMPTDVAGAAAFGIDLLYISAGIHSADYGDPDNPDPKALQAFLDSHEANPVAWLPRLAW
ncbi:MAG: TIGR01459 family HAD-type hydrolase [Nitratireductor sp.]|nr:TIGR01459 family HAD-type hydrolase [Nitratireductor sp.]